MDERIVEANIIEMSVEEFNNVEDENIHYLKNKLIVLNNRSNKLPNCDNTNS